MNYKNKAKNAFTIAEMAIVICIIAILVSLTVIANGFIERGKAQSLVYEITGYQKMIDAFRMTYNSLPGDFERASTDINSAIKNGNGNGKYDVLADGTGESFLAWQHLNYAGIIPDKYTGMTVMAGSQICSIGLNIPRSKIFPNAGYRITSEIPLEISQNSNMSKYKTIMEYASYATQTSTGRGTTGIVTPDIAYDVDNKMDDGKPLEGFVLGLNDVSNKCNSTTFNVSTGGYSSGATYIDSKNTGCIMVFVATEY
ncbi:type II secretion system protein [Candidatus Deianiraea vastatrix]|uniref:PulG/PilA-like type II secretion/type IV pilus pilin n=1 Tax=Candidatus Deianiraea vastatrix TaxID=2163644 RepID=A0A5B8XEV7_9RICK|nr:hypothetical protein [Candidatus Deianiraea vastatrix]QED23803.1 Putative PulG/PilA-like type II secretion/type IV pilus pilin [Candidatus Deianiraea vastatrix]